MSKFEELPDKIKIHLKGLISSTGLPDSEEALEILSANWLEKRQMFEAQIKSLDMVESDAFSSEDPRGALLLTYSGSLVTVGTLHNDNRWVEYASIKLRMDVPAIVKSEKVRLTGDIRVDNCAGFEPGPIKRTSEILTIAYCASDVSLAEQEKRIKEATIFLTNGFVKINRELSITGDAGDYQQFNMKSIVGYLAKRNNITQALTAQILDDYLYIVECGMLLGERVSLGRLGSMHLKVKAAQKARVGRNPKTGEEITINAKPETAVPRVSFSKHIKEKAACVDVRNLAKDEG